MLVDIARSAAFDLVLPVVCMPRDWYSCRNVELPRCVGSLHMSLLLLDDGIMHVRLAIGGCGTFCVIYMPLHTVFQTPQGAARPMT
jgi:hypothetical protein